jgi:hypothetical protein
LLSQGSPPSKPLPPTLRPTTAVPGVYITAAAAAAAAERIAALRPSSSACGRRKAATFAWSTNSVRHRAQEAAGKATMTDGGDSPSQQEPFANGAISMVSTAGQKPAAKGRGALMPDHADARQSRRRTARARPCKCRRQVLGARWPGQSRSPSPDSTLCRARSEYRPD